MHQDPDWSIDPEWSFKKAGFEDPKAPFSCVITFNAERECFRLQSCLPEFIREMVCLPWDPHFRLIRREREQFFLKLAHGEISFWCRFITCLNILRLWKR